ncbi:MAG: hypothetical protein KC491_04990 [Dehalococcoidia bacterium]|nr:hypothetical protein [Dehalococcoidia bacterium]
MGRWLKALGLGDSGGKRSSGPGRVPSGQRTSRIRETMRWRGFDLSAYSDEEIHVAADLLGPAISPEGETTDESRQALADLLLQRRIDPEAVPPEIPLPESAEAAVTPVEAEPASTSTPAEVSAEETPEAEPATSPPAVRRAPARPGETPTTLERLKHILGVHTWHLETGTDDEAQVLRCYGCRMERPAVPLVSPLQFPAFDGEEQGEASTRSESFDDASSERQDRHEARKATTESQETEPEIAGAAQAFRLFVRSPWWVKFVAVFIALQVAAVIVRLVSSAA